MREGGRGWRGEVGRWRRREGGSGEEGGGQSDARRPPAVGNREEGAQGGTTDAAVREWSGEKTAAGEEGGKTATWIVGTREEEEEQRGLEVEGEECSSYHRWRWVEEGAGRRGWARAGWRGSRQLGETLGKRRRNFERFEREWFPAGALMVWLWEAVWLPKRFRRDGEAAAAGMDQFWRGGRREGGREKE